MVGLCACGIAPAEDTACDPEVPSITWETFGEGFVTTHCQGCHASSSSDRQGAPEDVVFDSEADALWWRDAILDATASDPARMPPAGGIDRDDRERLTIWLTCFADTR
jgi:uncharacterized membrane protein